MGLSMVQFFTLFLSSEDLFLAVPFDLGEKTIKWKQLDDRDRIRWEGWSPGEIREPFQTNPRQSDAGPEGVHEGSLLGHQGYLKISWVIMIASFSQFKLPCIGWTTSASDEADEVYKMWYQIHRQAWEICRRHHHHNYGYYSTYYNIYIHYFCHSLYYYHIDDITMIFISYSYEVIVPPSRTRPCQTSTCGSACASARGAWSTSSGTTSRSTSNPWYLMPRIHWADGDGEAYICHIS